MKILNFKLLTVVAFLALSFSTFNVIYEKNHQPVKERKVKQDTPIYLGSILTASGDYDVYGTTSNNKVTDIYFSGTTTPIYRVFGSSFYESGDIYGTSKLTYLVTSTSIPTEYVGLFAEP